jgi:2-keto-4-pentenoate hydratase/2-oxohepta-3-ene-1,7-dioic acid hydratase in catechol pathway
MHLLNLDLADKRAPAVLVGDEILNIAAATKVLAQAKRIPHSIKGILRGGTETLDDIRRLTDRATGKHAIQLRDTGALIPREGAKLAAPITNPGLILAAGLNYHAHLKEMNDTPVPAKPNSFTKNPAAIIGTDAPIILPRIAPTMVDWEGELGVVIGRICRNVGVGEALSYVAGYTMINDVSARDWVPPVFTSTGIFGPILAWEQNILGKQFPTFCPVGPVIATADEIPDITDLHLETRVNGEIMQTTSTNDLVYNVAELISYYSTFYEFRPGDLIATGSPPGVGFGHDPKIFLKAGDVVEVIGDHIGTLKNTVVEA